MTDIPAQILRRTRNGEFTYQRVAIEACVTKDGRKSRYVVWLTHCHVCGCSFHVTSPATKTAIAHGPGVIRCASHRHRRHATSEALAREHALAARYNAPATVP